MKYVISCCILLVVLYSNAFAATGNEHGNGGNSIVCNSGTIEAMELYEARVGMRGFKIDLGPASLSVTEKLDLVLKRLMIRDPGRYAIWSEKVKDFFANAIFWNDSLPVLNDYGDIIIEPGCRVEQTIVQKISPYPEERIYRINQNIWNRLDNDSRATLVFHEVIWGYAYNSLQHNNSKKSRYYLEYLLDQKKMVEMSLNQYMDFLRFVDFRDISYLGIPLKLDSIKRDGNGAVLAGFSNADASVQIGKNHIHIKKGATIYYGWGGSGVSDVFRDNFGRSAIEVSSLSVGDMVFPRAFGEISFYKNGGVRWVRNFNDDIEQIPFKFSGDRLATFQNYGFQSSTTYSPGFGFAEEGQLRCGALAKRVELLTGKNSNGLPNIYEFFEGSCVRFDSDGFALHCKSIADRICRDF